jgi:trigger factor
MEYTVKERKSSEISLECINNAGEIQSAKREAYTKLAANAKIPGFRQGKAPYEIGMRFIGEGRILEEAVEILIDKTLSEVLSKENINPLGEPDIKVEKLEDNNLVFSCRIEFFPEVNVDLNEKIHLTYTPIVSEGEVDQKIKEIKDSFIELQPKDGVVETGDIVEVSISYQGHEAQTLTAEVGKDKVIGDFGARVIGKKKGDAFVVKSDSTDINFEILSIKRKIIPEVDDDLAKDAGFDNLISMKEKIKAQLLENKKLQFEENRGREALKVLVEKLDVELPQKFVEKEVEERLNELKDRYLKTGKKIEDVLKEENKTMDDFKNDAKKVIENEIKEELILRRIIKEKNLSVTEEEVKKEFENIALNQGADLSKISLTEELARLIRNEIFRSKAILILKENAIID